MSSFNRSLLKKPADKVFSCEIIRARGFYRRTFRETTRAGRLKIDACFPYKPGEDLWCLGFQSVLEFWILAAFWNGELKRYKSESPGGCNIDVSHLEPVITHKREFYLRDELDRVAMLSVCRHRVSAGDLLNRSNCEEAGRYLRDFTEARPVQCDKIGTWTA